MRVTLHDVSDLSTEQIQSWDDLLERDTAFTSPFLSYGFCRAVDELRGGVRVLQFEDADRTRGFLPFQLRKGRSFLGHAQKVGAEMSDYFGCVGDSGLKLQPDRILKAARLSSLRFDHGNAETCPFVFEDAEEQIGVRVRANDFPCFMAALKAADKYFVKTVTRAESQLAADSGAISFRWHTDDPSGDLDRLIAVKRQQYGRTNKPDNLGAGWQSALLRRLLCGSAIRNCQPILSSLYSGGAWLASNLSLGCGNVLHIWFPAYDVNYRRYGPGHMLFLKLIQAGIERGFTLFDFGEGESAYKKKYLGETYSLWKGVVTTHSVSGFAERALQSLEWRINKAADNLRGGAADLQT
jgi:CelD/BcsL family acetyltransferase involved in cellulose biosynthesis